MVAGPKRSLPTRATIKTSAPQSLEATAWLAPLPPKPRSNFWPKIVSPAFGNFSVKVVKSIFALPTTAIPGRFAIGFTELFHSIYFLFSIPKVKNAESSQRSRLLSMDLKSFKRLRAVSELLPVGYPDILHLSGVVEKPSALPLLHVEPVNGAALIGKDLLQIAGRKRLGRKRAGFVSETPDGIDVIVLSKNFEEL